MDLIFDVTDWFHARKAARWQALADDHARSMSYWAQVGSSLHTFHSGAGKPAGLVPGMHEAKGEFDHYRTQRDRCLAKAAKWRS
jgi:hypothetical protein